MKITFQADTYIRIDANDLSIPPVGMIFKGTEMNIDADFVEGVEQEGNGIYIKDDRNWHFWTGNLLIKTSTDRPKESDHSIENEEVGQSAYQNEISQNYLEEIFKEVVDIIDESVENNIHETVMTNGASSVSMPNNGISANGTTPFNDDLRVEFDVKNSFTKWASGYRPYQNIDYSDFYSVDESILELTNDIALEHEYTLTREDEIEEILKNKSYLIEWWHKSLNITNLFWSKQHLTGEGVNIVLFSEDFNPDHPDIANKPIDFKSFCHDDAQSRDYNLGTLFANLISGSGDNRILGIAPHAKLSIVKTDTSSSQNLLASFRKAADWAIDKNADIIVIGYAWDEALFEPSDLVEIKAILDMLYHKNIILISPVGDVSINKQPLQLVGKFESILNVGACDHNLEKHPETLSTNKLDVLVPAPFKVPNGIELNHPYVCPITGQAAATMAGTAALLVEYMNKNNITMTNHRFLHLIRHNAQPLGDSFFFRDPENGFGLFSPHRVMDQLEAELV